MVAMAAPTAPPWLPWLLAPPCRRARGYPARIPHGPVWSALARALLLGPAAGDALMPTMAASRRAGPRRRVVPPACVEGRGRAPGARRGAARGGAAKHGLHGAGPELQWHDPCPWLALMDPAAPAMPMAAHPDEEEEEEHGEHGAYGGDPPEASRSCLPRRSPPPPTFKCVRPPSRVRGLARRSGSAGYLIVIDDIWSKDAWENINYALPKNNCDSKIITTTRLNDIAKICCSSEGDVLYSMKPLGSVDAKKLFFERLSGSNDKCPAHLIDVSDKILGKCDGVPLALISISGLLSIKPQTLDEWDRVHNSIGHGLGKCPDVRSMIQILSLSYFDLPHHLKTCLLYISVYPEDSIIDKRSLIRRWISEGFIQEEHGYTPYALGERCFNELINRSLIQARNLNMYGEVTACQVHDTILDIIISKSEEENFVTVFDDNYQILGKHSKVRRISLQAKSHEKVCILTHLDLSHVRSVKVVGHSVEQPLWPEFRFLRVLDLQGCIEVEGYHLVDIGNLFQLRYLCLRRTGVCELPEQITKLQYLETLDLKETKVTKLPDGIDAMRRLVYLAVDKAVKLPGGAGRMTALEDLDCVDILKQSIDFTRELGQLKNLRNVRFVLHSDCSIAVAGNRYKEYLHNTLSSLSKLGHLQSLSINIEGECKEDFCLDSEGYPGCLRKLEIKWGYISKIPNWVGCLINLQLLVLYVKEFHVEDILALGRLPVLVYFRLVAHESFQGKRFTIRASDGFQHLKQFDFGFTVPVMFDVGAMPKLEKLTLLFSIRSLTFDMLVGENGDFPFGVQHLSSLQSVHSVVCWSENAMDHWITEKIVLMEKKGFSKGIEMADMIFTLAAATTSLLDAKLRQDPSRGQLYSFKRAIHTHPKFQELDHVMTWTIIENFATFAYDACLIYLRSFRLPILLRCYRHKPNVIATQDKATFNNIIRTILEDTTDAVTMRWIEDNAHAAT
ncbi:hypothetical protein EJB05_14572, partial [Eragrostis curvula]